MLGPSGRAELGQTKWKMESRAEWGCIVVGVANRACPRVGPSDEGRAWAMGHTFFFSVAIFLSAHLKKNRGKIHKA